MNAWLDGLTWPLLVRVIGTLLALAGIIACLRIAWLDPARFTPHVVKRLGVVNLPAAAFYKLLAFAALVVLPGAAALVANYHVFDGSRTVASCNSCHVMRPMVTDMIDPTSQTLAARHYRNKWIAEDQCETCHSDYGLAGSLTAKLTGYRHLARYVTHTYREPIPFRGRYIDQSCLGCHRGTPKWEAVTSHHTAWDRLADDRMDCLNCHGLPHPSAADRTPNSPAYARLMEGLR